MTFCSARGSGEHLPGALNQVIGLPSRAEHCLGVGFDPALANEPVGVEAALERDELEVEALFGQQGDGLFGCVGSGGVGVEVDHDVGGVALQNRHLLLGKGSSAGGNHVLDPAKKERDAVHLPFDEQRVASLPNGCLRLVEIEEDLALGVERRLRRVDVLGSGLVSRVEGASGERDDAAAFIGNGKHDALAEAVVDRTLASIALFLGAEQSAGAQSFLIGHAAQPIAKRVEAVGRKADAKGLDPFGCQPTSGQVLARDRSFGAAQLLFKPCRGSLMQIEELSAHGVLRRPLRARKTLASAAGFRSFARRSALLRGNRRSRFCRQS